MTEKNVIRFTNKEKIIMTLSFLLILGAIIFTIVEEKNRVEDCKANYTEAIAYLKEGDGKSAFTKLKIVDSGYADSTYLKLYANALNLAKGHDTKENIEKLLNRIPADYDGDLADEINEYKLYIDSDYENDWAEYWSQRKRAEELEEIKRQEELEKEQSEVITGNTNNNVKFSKDSNISMPDCDDYESYEEFMDDWDGCMPDGSDAEDYWENW